LIVSLILSKPDASNLHELYGLFIVNMLGFSSFYPTYDSSASSVGSAKAGTDYAGFKRVLEYGVSTCEKGFEGALPQASLAR
jgi:hypothetical protein